MENSDRDPSDEARFRAWLREVDALCRRRFGLRLDDLPDMLTRDAFDEGVPPEDFFEEDVLRVVREEFGELADDL
jgi:hypothetical protein